MTRQPGDTGTILGRGDMLNYTGRYEEAVKCHDLAIEVDPKRAESHIGKGDALDRPYRHGEAAECHGMAIEPDRIMRMSISAWATHYCIWAGTGRR